MTSKRALAALGTVLVLTALFVFGRRGCNEAPPASEPHAAFAAHSSPRSGKWPAVRKHYLEAHPNCEACGHSEKQSGQAIEVHHRVPFAADESKELDPDNLISLCRRCHLLIGHLDSWKSFNPSVAEDADRLLNKIRNRPKE